VVTDGGTYAGEFVVEWPSVIAEVPLLYYI
jgi:hypothetical protein